LKINYPTPYERGWQGLSRWFRVCYLSSGFSRFAAFDAMTNNAISKSIGIEEAARVKKI